MLEDLFENQNFTEPKQIGILIQPNSIYIGLSLTGIELPKECNFLGILREGKIILPSCKPIICVGDYVLAIAVNPMMVPALKVILKKTHRIYYSLNNCLIEKQFLDNENFDTVESNTLKNSLI